jgi:hypothetical protein
MFLGPKLWVLPTSPRLITWTAPSRSPPPVVPGIFSELSVLLSSNFSTQQMTPLLQLPVRLRFPAFLFIENFSNPLFKLLASRYTRPGKWTTFDQHSESPTTRHSCSGDAAVACDLSRIRGNKNVIYPFVTHPRQSPFLDPAPLIHNISTSKGWTRIVTAQYCA